MIEGTLAELTLPLLKALSSLPPELADQTLDALESHLDPAQPSHADENRQVNSADRDGEVGYYAVRRADLKVLEGAAKLAAGLFSFPARWPTLVIGLVLLLFRYHKTRIWLTAKQGIVLLLLKKHGELTVAEVCAAAPDTAKLDTSAVEEILSALQAAERTDGEAVKLVERDAESHWRALGV